MGLNEQRRAHVQGCAARMPGDALLAARQQTRTNPARTATVLEPLDWLCRRPANAVTMDATGGYSKPPLSLIEEEFCWLMEYVKPARHLSGQRGRTGGGRGASRLVSTWRQ